MHAKDLEPLLAPLRSPAVAELLGEADFELDPDDHLIAHLGKAVPKASLIAFGQHGSGSLLALWRRDKQTALARCPVIWLDSEGDPIEALPTNSFHRTAGVVVAAIGLRCVCVGQYPNIGQGDPLCRPDMSPHSTVTDVPPVPPDPATPPVPAVPAVPPVPESPVPPAMALYEAFWVVVGV